MVQDYPAILAVFCQKESILNTLPDVLLHIFRPLKTFNTQGLANAINQCAE